MCILGPFLTDCLCVFLALIAKGQGLGEHQAALLMAAFYPGYVLTQIPTGALAQKHGAKVLLLVCLVGTAVCFGGLPFAFGPAAGMLLPAALLTTMGNTQHPAAPIPVICRHILTARLPDF